MSTLMQSSNIVSLSLYDVEGSLLWSSTQNPGSSVSPDSSTFQIAANGETATGLSKNVAFTTSNGAISTGDLTTTYIPLTNDSSQRPSQILEVAREVTGVLDARVENTQGSMFRTLFTTLGASLAVLLGVVVSADTMINRSRRRSLEQERVAAESQMEAERLELRNQQLQQMNQERDKFLSMVSHELRTPLTSMLAFTEVLKRRQDGSNKDTNLDHLNLMRRNGDHLNSLIEELLEVTQIHADSFEIVKERLAFREIIQEVEKSGTALVRQRGQVLEIKGEFDGIELNADRKRVAQMMMNVLSNASLYSPEGSKITVEVEHKGNLAKICVIDEGIGIPEAEADRLFEQFFRCNNEVTRSHSGVGLGLPIVKAIVDAHDGKVSIKSQVGSGAIVTILLPATVAEPALA